MASLSFNEPILKKGNQGHDVSLLQTCLHGYHQDFPTFVLDPGPVDGIFGPKTEDSVKSFQSNVFGAVDGVVGPITWSQLDAFDSTFPTVDLSKGDTGNSVRRLQRLLFAAGSDPGPVDGIYGDKTASAVRDFEQKEGIPQTGNAAGQTRTALGFVVG